jgi:ribosomal protein L11 methylase PrmA
MVLDIGTGASCIYPLLGAKHFGWSFIASDIDSTAIASASCNVGLNDLAGKVTLVMIEDSQRLQDTLTPHVAAGGAHTNQRCSLDFALVHLAKRTHSLSLSHSPYAVLQKAPMQPSP